MQAQALSIDNPTTWNQTLLSLPWPHALQSWEWGAFKSRHGWTATRWRTERAAAQVLRRKLPRTPLSILYVPKGPTLDHDDAPAWEAMLAHLERLARRQKALFVKIDPDVRREQSDVRQRLLARGWRPSPEQIQFRNTMTLDLTQDEESLLAAMKSKWRYNVRLAGRKGVVVQARWKTCRCCTKCTARRRSATALSSGPWPITRTSGAALCRPGWPGP
jgi:lipid II:glycine glycyltransferase (peptidoglycan interpeptide bridge formation enzyme)